MLDDIFQPGNDRLVPLGRGGRIEPKVYRNKDGTRRYYLVHRWDEYPGGKRKRRSYYFGPLSHKMGYSISEWNAVCARFAFRCAACHQAKALTPDHMIPITRGGSDTIDNIQPLCFACNAKKKQTAICYLPLSSVP